MIGEVRSSARAVSGNAPFTLPTLIGPLPKLILRCLVSSAVAASGGKDCSRAERALVLPPSRTTVAWGVADAWPSPAAGGTAAGDARRAAATGCKALSTAA